MIPIELRADCSHCAALCCVLPAFARSADFPIDKAAGRACPNLARDDRCVIHRDLRRNGFVGCDVFDCFGAGQRLVAADPGRDRRQLADTFDRLRALHELMFHLDGSRRLVAGGLYDEVDELDRRVRATGTDPGPAATEALMHEGSDLLARVSASVRGGPSAARPGRDLRRADLVGRDLRNADLTRADLRGALLLGSDLRGVVFDRTDLLGCDLRGADVRGADLAGALFVTGPQVTSARGDATTRLPAGVDRPSHWAR